MSALFPPSVRFLVLGAVVAAALYLAMAIVGRAVDQQVVTRTFVVHNGVNLVCDRVVRSGDVYFENCDRVP